MTQSAIYLFSLCEYGYECVCVPVFGRMCTQVHAPRCVRGGTERTSGALFYPHPLYFLETGSLLELKLDKQLLLPLTLPTLPHLTWYLDAGCRKFKLRSKCLHRKWVSP